MSPIKPLSAAVKTEMKRLRDIDVDRKIDAALHIGLEHKQDAAQISFINTVVRPAMKWINDQEFEKVQIELVENAVAMGLASIMGEIALRVNHRDDLAGGQAFAQRLIIRLVQYLTDSLNLNFHPPTKDGN